MRTLPKRYRNWAVETQESEQVVVSAANAAEAMDEVREYDYTPFHAIPTDAPLTDLEDDE